MSDNAVAERRVGGNLIGLVGALALTLAAGCAPRPALPESAAAESAAPSADEFQMPVPETCELSNGLQVWLLRTKQVPLVSLALVVRGGSAQDPSGKEGLAALTGSMLDEGAGSRGALEIADEIDFLGADLSLSTRKEYTQVSLQTLARNLDPALEIFTDVLARPTFAEEDWQRVKRLELNALAQRREEPQPVAQVAANRAFYGEGHPYAHPDAGYETSVETIELEDVRECYRRSFQPRNATLVVVGEFTLEALRARLDAKLGAWRAAPDAPAPPSREISPPPPGKLRLILVEKPQAPQTVMRVYVPAPAFAAPESAPLVLANLIFGGMFTSRLNDNLREKNRFTYGAGSAVAGRRFPAHLVAASSINAPKTVTALGEFCREFQAMGSGEVSKEEIEKARATHRRRLIQGLETQSGLLGVYAESAGLGMPPAKLREFHGQVLRSSPEAVEKICRQVFRWERAMVVAVGEPSVFPATEIRDREGAP